MVCVLDVQFSGYNANEHLSGIANIYNSVAVAKDIKKSLKTQMWHSPRNCQKALWIGKKLKMTHYIALVHKDTDSAFGVQFPDVIGCFWAADNMDDLVANAMEALSL
jgi:HicB_like antitoxin of bacterial toxin-antitoxin system